MPAPIATASGTSNRLPNIILCPLFPSRRLYGNPDGDPAKPPEEKVLVTESFENVNPHVIEAIEVASTLAAFGTAAATVSDTSAYFGAAS